MVIGFVETFLMPRRVQRFNADLATDILRRKGQNGPIYTTEAIKELLGRRNELTGHTVKALDDHLIVYQECDLSSAVIGRPATGTEIQIGAMSEIEGRQWFEAALPNGDKGYLLAANARSHTA